MRRMDAGGYAACFDHQQLALLCANSDRTIDRLGVENNKLKAENAKLRELVESYGMIANEAVCDYYDRDEMLADANATASELGIEVGV